MLPSGQRSECHPNQMPNANTNLMQFQLLMLTTNMIRKDLNSQNQYDAGVALSGLSCFISPDLSRDLANDIMTLVECINPKEQLDLYQLFCHYR